jgi:Zn-dependent protease
VNSAISETIYWILFAIPSILIASTVHEYAHAWAAMKLGDPTAKAAGRLTLNPLSHIDPIGAISMLIFKFGWSKPVPINEYNFERRERDTALVSLAGPVSNILLLLLAAGINALLKPSPESWIYTLLTTFAMINCVLAVFNLIPIPPLDGHKIVRAIIPKGKLRYYWEKLESYYYIPLLLLLLPIFPFGSIASVILGKTLTKVLALLGFF